MAAATSYLSKNLPQDQNSLHKWTFSCWVKRSTLNQETYLYNFYDDDNNRGGLRFNADNSLLYYERVSGSTVVNKTTNAKFFDCDAWYHIVVAVDKSVSSPDTKIYVNGVETVSFSTDTDYTQNLATKQNDNGNLYINSYNGSADIREQSLAHVHWTSGYTYAASDFGATDATTGIWEPKTNPNVTYGTNGFFLKFENSAAMGTDSSGNSNTFTVNNNVGQNIDSPSNNFVRINPGWTIEYNSNVGYQSGGTIIHSNGNNWVSGVTGVTLDKGKWYFEGQFNTPSAGDAHVGIADEDKLNMSTSSGGASNRLFYYNDTTGYAYGYYGANGQMYFSTPSNGTQTASYGNTFGNSDTVGVFVDLDNSKLYFAKNGTIQNSGTGYTIQANNYYAFGGAAYGTNGEVRLNFGDGRFDSTKLTGTTYADANGEGVFKYSPNQGGAANFDSAAKNFYALNTTNIKEFGG